MRRSNAVVLGLVLSVLCISQAVAPSDPAPLAQGEANRLLDLDACVDTSVFVTGSFSNFGNWDVTLVGNLALCSRQRGGVDVYDISNPGAPQLLDQFLTGGLVLDVVVSGIYAYMADGDVQANNRGVTVLDISNPANLQQVGINTLPVNPCDVELADSLLFVADGTVPGNIWIMSLANPTSPVVIGTYPTPHTAKSVFVVDTLAYLALAQDGLAILDVSDPTQPELVGSLGGLAAAYDVFVVDTVAYVANLTFGLALVDVSDPTAPVLLSTYNTPGSANDVEVVGSVAHLADIDSGYLLLDVSNPAAPEHILTMPSADRTLGLKAAGARTFAAEESYFTVYWIDSLGLCGDGGLGPCEACDDGNTTRGDGCGDCLVEDFVHICSIHGLSTPGSLGGALVHDSLLYVASGDSGLAIFNARYAGVPVRLGRYNTPGSARRVDVEGTIAAVADQAGGLRLLDVSDPTGPFHAGHFATAQQVLDVDLVDTLAYLACPGAFYVVNVASPEAPSQLALLPMVSDGLDVLVTGDRALIAGGAAGLIVVDISNPVAPQVIGNHTSVGIVQDVEVIGDTVYIAAGVGGVQCLRLTPSGSFVSIFGVAVLNARALARQNRYLYVADQSVGLRLYDVFNPVDWSLVDTVLHPFTVTLDLTVAGGRLYEAVTSALYVTTLSIRGERWCGNGVLEPGEVCDDSDFATGDGCDSCCQLEPPPAVCGNGNVEYPETCDDGNLVAGDGCDPLCALEPAVCGNGILQYTENCDDGNSDPADGCTNSCAFGAVCGDGLVASPEECDDGARVDGDGCDANCQYEHTCGDGNLELGEECDDGNTDPLDGCAADCSLEVCRITLKGDLNGSHTVTSADVIVLVNFCFKSGSPPLPCEANGDVNCSGGVTSADIIRLVNYVFLRGPGPCDICRDSPLSANCL